MHAGCSGPAGSEQCIDEGDLQEQCEPNHKAESREAVLRLSSNLLVTVIPAAFLVLTNTILPE